MRERYRASLSDLADGAIDADTALARRDLLLNELQGTYGARAPGRWASLPGCRACSRHRERGRAHR
jgi:hypothetical protein